MKKEDKERIIRWLRSRRDFSEGVALYQELGCNLRLKREFAFGESPLLAEILADQFMSMAGVDERQLRRMSVAPVKVTQQPAYPPAPEPVKEMLRFRDKYPFLKDENCPDELKVMVSDLFTAYEAYQKAHDRLAELPDTEREQAFVESQKVVENYLKNRKIWDTLDYYKEHGALPADIGKAGEEASVEEEISQLTDLDLAAKLKSAVANESKHRKAVKSAQEKGESNEKAEAQLQYWENRKKALKEEIEKRKKK